MPGNEAITVEYSSPSDKAAAYVKLRESCQLMFAVALKTLGLNRDQAFGYAYDEMNFPLSSSSTSHRIAAYTALFACAIEYGSRLQDDDPFAQDAREELRAVYMMLSNNLEELAVPAGDHHELQRDIGKVRDSFIIRRD